MLSLIIVFILVLGCVLMASSHVTNVNKSAVAVFMGTVGWVIYICYGTDFVMSQHWGDYMEFLGGEAATSRTVKFFIYDNVFLKYVGRAASIVLFLLSTMTIVEILNNNGCFDFITEWVRTTRTREILWSLSFISFVLSANLDNLTTTTMMLLIMHDIVQNRRQRIVIACTIVLAVNTGGCLTVIGDPMGLLLWEGGAITATHFSAYLALPALLAWAIPTYLMGRTLPSHLDVVWRPAPYRGDDTRLNKWQRIVMLIVGIGGLWFIPTFHNITKLSPFLGALCVLAILWMVNEVFNRKLIKADIMVRKRVPQVLQYGSIQMILFVMGIMLTMGVVAETGALTTVGYIADTYIHNVWILGCIAGLISGIMDTFTVAVAGMSIYPVADFGQVVTASDSAYLSCFTTNGAFWKILAFSSSVGGCLLCFATTSGLAMKKMEKIHVGWYFKNITPKILVGWIVGIAVLWAEINIRS